MGSFAYINWRACASPEDFEDEVCEVRDDYEDECQRADDACSEPDWED